MTWTERKKECMQGILDQEWLTYGKEWSKEGRGSNTHLSTVVSCQECVTPLLSLMWWCLQIRGSLTCSHIHGRIVGHRLHSCLVHDPLTLVFEHTDGNDMYGCYPQLICNQPFCTFEKQRLQTFLEPFFFSFDSSAGFNVITPVKSKALSL